MKIFDKSLIFISIVFHTATAQTTDIPDLNFEEALISLGHDTGEPDGKVLTENIKSVRSLDLSLKNINDLTGIEDFESLTTLICTSNKLKKLDVSKNLLLDTLWCNDIVLLKELDLSNNVNLTYLVTRWTSIEHLDLSCNKALIQVVSAHCNLKSINLANGNNHNLAFADFRFNTGLNCIQVDSGRVDGMSVLIKRDDGTGVSENCGYSSCKGLSSQEKSIEPYLFVFFPNPAYDKIYIKCPEDVEIFDISLIDIRGIGVKKFDIKSKYLDISDVENGWYLLKINTEKGIVLEKVLKRI